MRRICKKTINKNIMAQNKLELYSELTISLLKKDHPLCIDTCRNIISIQSAESTNLVVFFIDFFIENILSNNLFIIDLVSKKLRVLISIPKKNICSSPIFLSEVSELITIFIECNESNKVNTIEEYDISTIEALISNFGKKRYSELDFLNEQGKVTSDMFKILNILFYKIRHHEKKEVLGIVSWLLTLKTLAIDEISYDEIKHIKCMKNDIIWYIWKIALIYAKDCDFVKHYLNIFTTLYQKKYRQSRLHILYHVLMSISNKKTIFNESIKYQHSSAMQNVDAENEPDTSYLKCYTQFDKELANAVKLEKESIRRNEQIKVLSNS